MKYRLGLKPVESQPKLRLVDYLKKTDLPSVESLKYPLGHVDAIKPAMLKNDVLGDCAIAGSIEEVRLANALRGVTAPFTDDTAVANYSQIAGYNPDDPNTDQGTDVHELYEFRKSTGILDADGNRHKVVAYIGLTPGDFDELLIALSLFDMVGIGIQCPDYIDQQFDAGQPWHLERGRHPIEGGHYIPIVGATDRNTAQLYTWGGVGGITSPFYHALSNVAVVAFTEEILTGGKTPEGLDADKLLADLEALHPGPVMATAPKRAPRAKGHEAHAHLNVGDLEAAGDAQPSD